MSMTGVIELASYNNSVDEQMAVTATNRGLQDAIRKLVRAQESLVRPLTDEGSVAWQILDDAIGYLIRVEYPLRDLLEEVVQHFGRTEVRMTSKPSTGTAFWVSHLGFGIEILSGCSVESRARERLEMPRLPRS